MTNQQGAPEALAHELFTAAQLAPGEGISDAVARIAALVEAQQPADCGNTPYDEGPFTLAQQPAPSEQQPFGWIKQSEIDSSKDFGGSINLWRHRYDCDVPVYLAQQPAPSAAAAKIEGGPPGSGGWEKHAIEMERQRDHYRQRCHTMEEHQNGGVWYWQGDDGDNLESMGNSMLVVIRADQLRSLMQPSPTPQADSQPAPVAAFEVADAIADSQYLAGVSAGWNAANADDPNAALRKLHESRAGYLKPLSAARAPADSVTAPAGRVYSANCQYATVEWLQQTSDVGGGDPKNSRSWPITGDAVYLTPPAQAADSVLEDADPLQGAANWLAEAHGQFGVAVLQGCLMIGYNRAKRLHDAAIAARKQGANHDNT